jgi:plasmid maintenance system antidote protein VapI
LRLAKRFRNSARFWMALQAEFDLQLAQREARQG